MSRQIRQGERVLVAATLPAMRLTGEVATARPGEQWEAQALRLRGDGLNIEVSSVSMHQTPGYYDLSGTLHLQAAAPVAEGLAMGLLPEALQVSGAVELSGTAGVRLPLEGVVGLHHVSSIGELRVARLLIDNEPLDALTTRFRVEQGRVTVTDGMVGLHGGRVRLGSPSFVTLPGPVHDFRVHLVAEQLQLGVQSGKRLALSRILFLLTPLFFLEPERNKPIEVSGQLGGEIQLAGRYEAKPGWSQSTHGQGHFRIERGAVVGSTLVSRLVTKALLLPQNLVHNALQELFAQEGKVGQALTRLGEQAFVFGTLASPIQVQAGVVRQQKDLTITSPELSLVVNGHSTLEGDVDYHVRSDLIHRLRFGEVTSLPEKIPLLGKVIRYINPFTLLEGIELEATVRGNTFRRTADGPPAVHVETSILR